MLRFRKSCITINPHSFFSIMLTDQLSNLAEAICEPNLTTQRVSVVALKNKIVPLGIFYSIMTDNGPQIVSKSFDALSTAIETTIVTNIEYHLQGINLTGGSKKLLVARLRHYTDESRTSWDTYVQTFTYRYNTQVHCPTDILLFMSVQGQKPFAPLVSEKTGSCEG